jgi:hypothetical protein
MCGTSIRGKQGEAQDVLALVIWEVGLLGNLKIGEDLNTRIFARFKYSPIGYQRE